MALAPVILFAYNRPDHTLKTLNALAANVLAKSSEIFIYIDGAKQGASVEAKQQNEKVKEIAEAETRFARTTVRSSTQNKGLANSVILGVTEILDRYGKAIVLEDDLITSTGFLQFMNESLDRYANTEDVCCISAYIYPVADPLPETFFLKGADCWGWATWKRAWQEFEPDGEKLLARLEQNKLTQEFDFFGSFPYTKMLKDQIEGKNNSWAIRWYASAFLKDRLTLYPGRSLVRNIGIDGTGTHSGKKNYWHTEQLEPIVRIENPEILESLEAKMIVAKYFRSIRSRSLGVKLRRLLRSIINRFSQ